MHVEEIERESLYHFYPGARVLRPGALIPSDLVQEAVRSGARCVALPAHPGPHVAKVVNAARTCRERGLLAIGGLTGEAACEGRGVDLGVLDAATVEMPCGLETSLLQATLGRLRTLLDGSPTWVEIVVQVSPGEADSERSIDAASQLIADILGPDVPVHFEGLGALEALRHARWIAMSNGLHWVYVDSFADPSGRGSWCPGCDALLVAREHSSTRFPGLAGGACTSCGWPVPGRFARAPNT